MASRISLILALAGPLAVGCTADGGSDKDSGDPGVDDTGEGGGGGVRWRPAGEGSAYFADGTSDNSLFHLEMGRCIEPEEGTAYYGFVTKGGADAISLGEIPVTGEDVTFESDIGVNAIIQGYDTFEAWVNADGLQGSGTALWTGQVDPVIYDRITNLLIASDQTPDGAGSLRSVETAVEALRDEAQDIVDDPPDLTTIHTRAEGIANAIRGDGQDLDDSGDVVVFGDGLPILEGGYIDLIIADLTTVSDQVVPGDPIKDYANYAIDCTQAIESHATYAAINAEVATVSAADVTATGRLGDAVVELQYALDGQDVNEDGTVDLLTEGTIECALLYVSEMAQMSVATP